MKDYFPRLIRYTVGDVDTPIIPQNFVERPLVLVAQDEMTSQAHDTVSKSWVLDDQHKLRKKGVGCGLHQSDVICSTVGWLFEASQTLEYGKNYDGYWTGDMFCTQKKSFRHLKGPMDQVIKHYSWLTILKAIQHMLKMPWLQTA
ncbi:hypothetical protein C0993_001006 [Termitomyces sp. T159_Od127]|nr:hypothetical protein C0993_001006 [Termitomyces sp. T159_Od127]